jgi:hypothetical protein
MSVLVAAWALTGCQERSGDSKSETPRTVNREAVAAPAANAEARPRRGRIATIAEISAAPEGDKRTQIEVVMDEAAKGNPLEPGMFLRVQGESVFKGLLQLTEVLGPTRAIARQIGVTDRTRPLTTGDKVEEVADLAALAAPEAVETAAKNQQLRLDQMDAADRRLFEAVRVGYQRSLDEMTARQQAERQDAERVLNERLAAQENAHQAALARQAVLAQSDLAVVRASAAQQVEQALAAERAANATKLNDLTAERDRLRVQVDGLIQAKSQDAAAVEAALHRASERENTAAAQVRAEVETREVLQARLAEVEAKLSSKPVPATIVLTADPTHSETVLERLTRVSTELATVRAEYTRLRESLLTAEGDVGSLRRERDELTQRCRALVQADAQARAAQATVADIQRRLTEAEQSRAGLERARLDAERRLFDLAARVLRLDDPAPATVALQARLRASLEAESGGGK